MRSLIPDGRIRAVMNMDPKIAAQINFGTGGFCRFERR